jgi:sialate O-acetylesterase
MLFGFAACAEVKPNSLFADNCVLQRGVRVPVWGTAASGEKITVCFAGQAVSTIASNGTWKIWLKSMKASATPQNLIIAGDRICTFTNVFVGDVWVAGDQSNMERQLGPRPPQPQIVGWKEAAATADFPEIREYYVPEHIATAPAAEAGGNWKICSPATAPEFSAVGFYFARAIHQAEKVPVGILFSAWGGTMVEAWTSAASLEPVTDFRGITEAIKNPTNSTSQLVQTNKTPTAPSVLYNAMIAPLQSFPIKGVIWYQGEANNDRANQYRELFPLLIADWRKGWDLGDFPFLFVQIAPFKAMKPELREAQFLTLKKSRQTAMVVTTDIGDPNNIHPARKAPVGERLALAARALAYGEKVEYSGPLFSSLKIKDSKAVISFTHTVGGLVAQGGVLKGFTIAGADGKFVPAQAEIKGRTVAVWSDEVKSPVSVRYGWANVPDVNLYNREGLPASPFRTDIEQQ